MADYFGKNAAVKIFAKMETVAELREHSNSDSQEFHFCNELLRVYLKKLEVLFVFLTLTEVEVALGINKGKIEAVKAFKNRTGVSLMEAKRNVEQFFCAHGYEFYKG